MGSETKAAIIGAVVGGVISALVSIWSISRTESIEIQNRTFQSDMAAQNNDFQESLENLSVSRTVELTRANNLLNIALDIMKEYGDVTAVKNMSDEKWYELTAYEEMLKILGADDVLPSFGVFLHETKRDNLGLGQPGRDKYYKDLENLTNSFKKEIDGYYDSQKVESK